MAFTVLQHRRDAAATWTSNDPTLAAGEIGFETDTGKFKIGNGSTAWTSLGYAAQAHNAGLDEIVALAKTDGNIIVGNGTSWVAESGATARTSLGLGTGNTVGFAKLAAGLSAPTGDTTLHVRSGDSGAAAHIGADDLVVEHSTSGGITILCPDNANSNMRFGCPSNPSAGLFQCHYDSGYFRFGSNNAGFYMALMSGAFVEGARLDADSNFGVGTTGPDYKCHVNGTFGCAPGASVTPVNNGDVVIEATNNTTLTFKLKGSDGTVRSGTLTLA